MTHIFPSWRFVYVHVYITQVIASFLWPQARRLDGNHPGFVADFTLQELAATSTHKVKEMNASSLAAMLSSLANLGYLPSPEDWAVYADCIEALSGQLQGLQSNSTQALLSIWSHHIPSS